jgi:hypothetical protein
MGLYQKHTIRTYFLLTMIFVYDSFDLTNMLGLEDPMSLAQVIYNMSTDSDFSAMWKLDPEAALAGKGLKLSRDELTFLRNGLKRNGFNNNDMVHLSDLARKATNWRN